MTKDIVRAFSLIGNDLLGCEEVRVFAVMGIKNGVKVFDKRLQDYDWATTLTLLLDMKNEYDEVIFGWETDIYHPLNPIQAIYINDLLDWPF